MDNYDLIQMLTEENKMQEIENFDVISVQDALLALLPKAMEVAF